MTRRVAVLVSGSGRSLENLLRRERVGALGAEIALVVASKAGIGAIARAEAFGVEAVVAKESEVTQFLVDRGIDLAVLAGYLRRWPIPESFVGRAINIHPALLPLFGGKGFYGHHVHEAVIRSGMRVSGCTVHFVSQDYDQGPIIAQRCVPVHPDDTADTLADRVFAAELELLPECVRAVAKGEIRLEGGRVVHARG